MVSAAAPDFVQRVTAMMLDGKGDLLPVSALPVDGTFPTGTTQWEKRSIAQEIPIWDETICTQCAICPLTCPHAAIRMNVFPAEELKRAPPGFKAVPWARKDGGALDGMMYSLQVAPDDCTGCGICVDVCPTRSKTEVKHKAINMAPKLDHLEAERCSGSFKWVKVNVAIWRRCGIEQAGDPVDARCDLLEQLQPLSGETVAIAQGDAGEVACRAREVRHDPGGNRIARACEHDGDGSGGLLGG